MQNKTASSTAQAFLEFELTRRVASVPVRVGAEMVGVSRQAYYEWQHGCTIPDSRREGIENAERRIKDAVKLACQEHPLLLIMVADRRWRILRDKLTT